ncbi:MAG: hypothetical protein AVDCRST_MAG89-4842, partial [uncultured Gemmatimonadetes bacterium]
VGDEIPGSQRRRRRGGGGLEAAPARRGAVPVRRARGDRPAGGAAEEGGGRGGHAPPRLPRGGGIGDGDPGGRRLLGALGRPQDQPARAHLARAPGRHRAAGDRPGPGDADRGAQHGAGPRDLPRGVHAAGSAGPRPRDHHPGVPGRLCNAAGRAAGARLRGGAPGPGGAQPGRPGAGPACALARDGLHGGEPPAQRARDGAGEPGGGGAQPLPARISRRGGRRSPPVPAQPADLDRRAPAARDGRGDLVDRRHGGVQQPEPHDGHLSQDARGNAGCVPRPPGKDPGAGGPGSQGPRGECRVRL